MDERWTALPFRNTVMLAMGSSVWTSHVASNDVGFGWKRFTRKDAHGFNGLDDGLDGAAIAHVVPHVESDGVVFGQQVGRNEVFDGCLCAHADAFHCNLIALRSEYGQ